MRRTEHGHFARARTSALVKLIGNSPVRSSNFKDIAAQMTTHGNVKTLEGITYVTLIWPAFDSFPHSLEKSRSSFQRGHEIAKSIASRRLAHVLNQGASPPSRSSRWWARASLSSRFRSAPLFADCQLHYR